MMIIFSLVFHLGILSPALSIPEKPMSDEEACQFSYYLGCLIWRDYLNKLEIPYHFDEMIKGIKDTQEGKYTFKNNQDLASLIQKFQSDRTHEQAIHYLKEAENYLYQISKTSEAHEIYPQKLYYTVIQAGSSQNIHANSLIKFVVKRLNDGNSQIVHTSPYPIQLNLEETIEGFKKGVENMKIGEKRIIYIHPDLAYGSGRVCVPPNSLIIFEVETF